MEQKNVVIIGGGPAGFFAAIRYAELTQIAGNSPRVCIYERSDKTLSKVLVSGGGRCNVTHACFEPGELVKYYPRGASALRGAFTKFQPRDTVEWFKSRGVELKAEKDGRMFPVTNSSKTIIECLTTAATKAGVELKTKHTLQSIEQIESEGYPFKLTFHDQESGEIEEVHAKAILIATGSAESIHRMLIEKGITVKKAIPSLFTFVIKDKRLEEIPGLSVAEGSAAFLELDRTGSYATQVGPILITHWGLSGPAILRLSAWGAKRLAENKYHDRIRVNWLHPQTVDEVGSVLTKPRTDARFGKKSVIANSAFSQIAGRMWRKFTEAAGIREEMKWADLSNIGIRRLAEQLTCAEYEVNGKGVYKDEFVTCGGVDLDQVSFKDMQSKQIAGLYFAGEVMDVDGVTGGFNFQNAWTTGWLAGSGMYERVASSVR
jgi:predicted Rossmann fold flavoprotein